MSAKDICRCGHEREWHDSCSRCYCPFFLPSEETSPKIRAAWRKGEKARRVKENR